MLFHRYLKVGFLVDQRNSISMEIRPLSPRLRHLVDATDHEDIGPHIVRPLRNNGTQTSHGVDDIVKMIEKRANRPKVKHPPKVSKATSKAWASRVLEVGKNDLNLNFN
jgi:hypothetical protein